MLVYEVFVNVQKVHCIGRAWISNEREVRDRDSAYVRPVRSQDGGGKRAEEVSLGLVG